MKHISDYLRNVFKRRRKKEIAQDVMDEFLRPYNLRVKVTSVRGDTIHILVSNQHTRMMLEGFLKESLLTEMRNNGLMVSFMKVRLRKE